MDRSECGVRHKWDHVETERRREAFNAWVRTQANKAGFRLMPPAVQGTVHGMLRAAFYAGSNWQRRHGAIAAAPSPPAEQASGELLADLELVWHSVSDSRETNAAYERLKAALSQRPVVGGYPAVALMFNGEFTNVQKAWPGDSYDKQLAGFLKGAIRSVKEAKRQGYTVVPARIVLAPQQPRHSCGVDAVSDCPACQKDAAEQGYETP